MPPTPNDPGEIKVSLSLLSGEDTQAAKSLAEALKQIASMFEAIKSSDFLKQAEKMSEIHKDMTEKIQGAAGTWASNPQMPEGRGYERASTGVAPQEPGGPSRPPGGPPSPPVPSWGEEGGGPDIQHYPQSRWDYDARTALGKVFKENAPDVFAGTHALFDPRGLSRREAFHAAVQAKLPQDVGAPGKGTMSDPNMAYVSGQGGTPTASTSSAGGAGPGGGGGPFDQFQGERWLENVDTSLLDKGFEIPRFGGMTPQDYLRMMSQRRLKQAAQLAESGDIERARARGQRASEWQRAAEYYVPVHEATRRAQATIQRAGQFMQNQGLDPRGWTQAGYEGGGTPSPRFEIPGTNIGMELPFDPGGLPVVGGWFGGGEGGATRYGWNESKAIMKMRAEAGINKEQAEAYRGALAGAGWGIQERPDILTQLAPAIRAAPGLDPQQVAMMTQTLRTGAQDVSDLTKRIESLAKTSRDSGKDINELAKAMNEMGEFNTQRGGTWKVGAEAGERWKALTGLDAQVLQGIQESPMYSTVAMQKGVMPGAEGVLSPEQQLATAAETVERNYQLFTKSGAQGVGQRRRINVDGQSTEMPAPKGEVAAALAAQQSGISVDQLRHLRTLNRYFSAEEIVEGYGQGVRRWGGSDRAIEAGARREGLRGEGITWGETERALRKLPKGVFTEERLKEIREMKPKEREAVIDRRIEQFRKNEEKRLREDKAPKGLLEIRFKGKAKDIFETALKGDFKKANKRAANAAKKTVAEAGIDVEGFDPLGLSSAEAHKLSSTAEDMKDINLFPEEE